MPGESRGQWFRRCGDAPPDPGLRRGTGWNRQSPRSFPSRREGWGNSARDDAELAAARNDRTEAELVLQPRQLALARFAPRFGVASVALGFLGGLRPEVA